MQTKLNVHLRHNNLVQYILASRKYTETQRKPEEKATDRVEVGRLQQGGKAEEQTQEAGVVGRPMEVDRLLGVVDRLLGVVGRLPGVVDRLLGVVGRLPGVVDRLLGVVGRLLGVVGRLLGVDKSAAEVVDSCSLRKQSERKLKLEKYSLGGGIAE